jgi:AbrB family looped-hinge helix DNA binding protein
MQKTVKIRKGKITIPAKIRKKLGIKEGDHFLVEAIEDKIVIKRIPDLLDLVGVFSGHADMEEIKKELDKIREEY